MKKVIAIIATIIIGYFATVLGSALINWPQLGPIGAIATMGAFILDELETKQDK